MERLYVYQGAFAVLGVSFLLNASAAFAAGEWDLVPVIFGISGSGLVLSSGFESIRTDPSEFTISAGSLFVMVGAACLSLLLTVLDVAISL